MSDTRRWVWPVFFARLILGLMFFMAGTYKVFQMGAVEHARTLFVEPYAETFLPVWALWVLGTLIPFIEFGGGALLLAGLRRRETLIALGSVLVIVTFGHLLKEPFFELQTHVIPRLLLLLFLLLAPPEADFLSLESWLERRGAAETSTDT